MNPQIEPDNNSTEIVQDGVASGYVSLPFSANQFRDFIKSLLGSPQAITRVLPHPFEVSKSDIRSIHDLLMQRVTQQNHGFLAQFKSRVGFSDDTGDEQNSIESFMAYNQVRPVETTSITIKWNFLIKFEDKDTLERQVVTISFYAKPGNRYLDLDETILGQMIFFRAAAVTRGVIQYRIEHTARTWGADIDALLSGQLQEYTVNQPRLRRIINKHSEKIGIASAAWILISCLLGLAITTSNFSRHQEEQANKVLSVPYDNLASVGKRLDFLAGHIAAGLWEKYFLGAAGFMLLSLVLCIVIGTWAESSASARFPSFILFSRSDSAAKTREKKRLERNWQSFLLSAASAILYGITSNLIFRKLFE
jgi:hypothetical protein